MSVLLVSRRMVRTPCSTGAPFEFGEQSAADAESAGGRCDPHPFQLGRPVAMELQGAASDRLATKGCEQEQSCGEAHLGGVGGKAAGWVEAAAEALVELGEVVAEAVARHGVDGVDDRDVDQRGGQQSLDLGHCGDEPGPLGVGERGENRAGEVVASSIEQVPLGATFLRQVGSADAPVAVAGTDGDESGGLERSKEPAEVTRVEPEPGAQRAHFAAIAADLPQHSGFAERPVAGEVVILEGADPLGDDPVERPHRGNHLVHIADLSQRSPVRFGSRPCG